MLAGFLIGAEGVKKLNQVAAAREANKLGCGFIDLLAYSFVNEIKCMVLRLYFEIGA